MRRWAVSAAIASLVTTLVALQAAPAEAATAYYETVKGTPSGAGLGCGETWMSKSWGEGCFLSDNDSFWINDRSSDGMSVAVNYKVGSTNGIVRDKLGTSAGNTIKDLNFPENTKIYLRIGRCNQSSTNDCRQAADYKDWYPSGFWIIVDTSDNGKAYTG